MEERTVLLLGAVSALLAVIAGSLGAHGLESSIIPEHEAAFDSGVRYHMYHALAILAATGFVGRFRLVTTIAVSAFLAGIIVFCGSMYAVALTGASWLGATGAFGGMLFIMGWLSLALGFWLRGERVFVHLPGPDAREEPAAPRPPGPVC